MPISEKLLKRCKWIAPAQRTYEMHKRVDEILSSMRIMSAAGHQIAGSGAGKTVMLHSIYEKVTGKPLKPYLQGIGDCVSMGWAKGATVLSAVESLDPKQKERYPGMHVATEWIYGTSRVIQGRGQLRNNDGSVGAWAAAAVKENGLLFRKKYDAVDLTRYSAKRAKDWGFRGLPFDMEVIADEHPILETALCSSWEQFRDSIANGMPVAICSNRGFTDRRDREGFAAPKGQWMHCMIGHGMKDDNRPGGVIDNSWGPDWISGPRPFDIPKGSFLADADVIDRMLRQGDSYTIAGIKGFAKSEIDLDYSVLHWSF